jgi:hypothetical protein
LVRRNLQHSIKIRYDYVEEIDNVNNFYHDGVIEFQVEYVKDIEKKINDSGFERTVKQKILSTMSDLPFKQGDMIIINREHYTIQQIERKLDRKYETLISRSPHLLSRYQEKVLTLNDNR